MKTRLNIAKKQSAIEKLRLLPTEQVEDEMHISQMYGWTRKFWRCYFELALRRTVRTRLKRI